MTQAETSAKDLVTTTKDTLEATAFMLKVAKIFLERGVEPKDGAEQAFGIQLKTLKDASEALDALATIYGELEDGINQNFTTAQASSWS